MVSAAVKIFHLEPLQYGKEQAGRIKVKSLRQSVIPILVQLLPRHVTAAKQASLGFSTIPLSVDDVVTPLVSSNSVAELVVL